MVKYIFFYRNSKFIPYQEVKIQETADQTPAGNIPKTFNVIAKGENTRMCSPGDIVIIQGIFLPTQMDTWLGAMSIVNVRIYFFPKLRVF